MADNKLATIEPQPFLDRDKVELLKRTIAKGATDDELDMFLARIESTRLDPFLGQIFAVKRRAKDDDGNWTTVMSIQTGVAGLELIAHRTGEFQGLDGPYWCGPDGEWRDVWLSETYPAAAKVGVYRKGFVQPLYGIALWREYVQTTQRGDVTSMWKTKATVMIAKCAESLALRKAFPAETSGLYTAEEMGTRSDSVITIDAEVIDVGTGEIIEAPPVRAISHNNPATVPADFEPQQFRDNVVAESNRRYEERAPSWNAIYGPARTKGLLPVQVQALACKRYGLAKHSDMSADDMIDLAQYIEQTDADTLKQEAGA
jgi:phage recombination protein Bet